MGQDSTNYSKEEREEFFRKLKEIQNPLDNHNIFSEAGLREAQKHKPKEDSWVLGGLQLDNLEEFYRNTGRTTRLIGLYIDDLFTYGKTNEVRDHYKFGEDHKANVLLFDKIINRLYHEHQSFYLNNIQFPLTLVEIRSVLTVR